APEAPISVAKSLGTSARPTDDGGRELKTTEAATDRGAGELVARPPRPERAGPGARARLPSVHHGVGLAVLLAARRVAVLQQGPGGASHDSPGRLTSLDRVANAQARPYRGHDDESRMAGRPRSLQPLDERQALRACRHAERRGTQA